MRCRFGIQRQIVVDADGQGCVRQRRLPGQLGEPVVCGIDQIEHHLEKGTVAAALGIERLHQHLERHVEIGLVMQVSLARAAQMLGERQFETYLVAQHHCVHEGTHQMPRLRMIAIGSGRADDDLALAAPAGEECGEHRLQADEQRHTVFEQDRRQLLLHRWLDMLRMHRTTPAVDGRTRTIQMERMGRGRSVQASAPIGFQHWQPVADPRTLPRCVVAVLHGQRRQSRAAAGSDRRMRLAQFGGQHIVRPGIGGDVMHIEQQPILLGQLDQSRIEQRPDAKIADPSCFSLEQVGQDRAALLGVNLA
ncbi:hypothetical protein NB705_001704 [Xanthomonas sacchari]|nr:hypothetical protein [Xanthomonas sacchari]